MTYYIEFQEKQYWIFWRRQYVRVWFHHADMREFLNWAVLNSIDTKMEYHTASEPDAGDDRFEIYSGFVTDEQAVLIKLRWGSGMVQLR